MNDHLSRREVRAGNCKMQCLTRKSAGNPYRQNYKLLYKLAAFCIVFAIFGHKTVFGEEVLASESNNSTCACGVDRVPCAKSLTSSDCPNGRVIPRRDCPCCFLCAKQLTEDCDNEELLCDVNFGLECGPDKKCKAKVSCSDDTSCSNDMMCVGGACADACKVLPDVCKESSMANGICIARNHRALCTCPPGTSLNSEKECVPSEEEKEGGKCQFDGRHFIPGESTYKDNCTKSCKCETSGEMTCEDVSVSPACKTGFIPMSAISGEMTDACKILVGNDALFDGCCVPEKCQVIKSQDNSNEESKGSRDFKLTESQNNLGDDDKSKLKFESTKDLDDGSGSASEPEGMQVTVMKRTDHSAVIDLPKNEKEAVLSIALSKELIQNPGSAELWKEHKIPSGLSQITLSTLLPNTTYTLKYSAGGKDFPTVQFITEEATITTTQATLTSTTTSTTTEAPAPISENEKEGTTTMPESESESSTEQEEISAPTSIPTTTTTTSTTEKPTEIMSMLPETTLQPVSSIGCLHNGTSYEIGEIFHIGCDESCECMKNGEIKCIERCSIPLFKKGAFAHDKMCFEEPSGIDECCVLIACARGTPTHGRSEESGRDIAAVIPQPCDAVKCGANAHCLGPAGLLSSEEEQQTNQTLCVCNDGFIGDPYDTDQGCQSNVAPTSATEVSSSASAAPTGEPMPMSSSSSTSSTTQKMDGCVSKNKTYEFGEEQLDDCSYKCRCETSGEFLCVPRCNYRRDEEKEIPAGCEIQKDPSDLECCEMLVCHGEPLESGTRKDSPTVPTDGCTYKNKSYAREEKFYDGCDHQCMCFSNGDVTCQPRCPPAASNSSGDDCVILPDPADKCCTVSVCGNSTLSDVMKNGNATDSNSTISEPLVIPAHGEGRSSLPSKPAFSIRFTSAHPLNESTIMVAIRVKDASLDGIGEEPVTVRYSSDTKDWKEVKTMVKDAIRTANYEITVPVHNLKPNTEYHFTVSVGSAHSNPIAGSTRDMLLGSLEEEDLGSSEFTPEEPSEEVDATTEDDSSAASSAEKLPCPHKGKKYEYGEDLFDDCDAYCTCGRNGKMKCAKIECPTDFGLDLIDDTCTKWEVDPKAVKKAPNCCPKMICMEHSSCTLEDGLVIRNFDPVPQKLTGCDKECHCEYGNITCRDVCPPMSEHPPPNLPCPKEFAVVVTMPDNECCYQWSCRMAHIPHHHFNNITAGVDKGEVVIHPGQFPNLVNTTPATTGHSKPTNNRHDRFPPAGPHKPPTLVHIDKVNIRQLQELLHHLTSLGEEQVFVQVKTPDQVRELERDLGAQFVERGEDGGYIVVIPAADAGSDPSLKEDFEHDHIPQFPHPPPPPHGFLAPGGHHFPFGVNPFHPGGGELHQDRTKVANIRIHPLNESTLQIDFTVSPILVGLQGHVEVLYTREFEQKPNPAQWERKVFQQAEDLIDNTHLQLFLTALQPDTEYHVQIKVVVMQSDVGSISDIMRARTLPQAIPTSTLPPEIMVDPEVQLRSANSNSVRIHWRKFNELEKGLIDGVQIAYKANDDKVYSTTPLIHRSLDEYEVEGLQPDKEYEIKLLFIPFDTNQSTILKSEKPIFVRTTPAEDEYSFNIAISSGKVTETSAELNIEGIPHPEDKFVNIYQVIYMSGSQKEQKDYFKVPKRETSKKATLTDLRPATNYTLWLEAFLSNGKKKRSNVISIQTKAGQLPRPEMSGQDNYPNNLHSADIQPPTSYYGALVALAVVAALSIIGVIALLMILIKKQSYAKAAINDRKSESSYDNPSFKSYDVESNGQMKPSEL